MHLLRNDKAQSGIVNLEITCKGRKMKVALRFLTRKNNKFQTAFRTTTVKRSVKAAFRNGVVSGSRRIR